MESHSKVNNSLPDLLAQIVTVDLSYAYADQVEIRKNFNLENLQPAGVCVLFGGSTLENAKILLTERAVTLPTHAGQVAFPGGMIEPIDGGDVVRAALRECEEEVGVPASHIRPVGILPPFPTVTGGFKVTPVLALWNENGHSSLPPFALSSEVQFAEWVNLLTLFSTRKTERHTVQNIEIQSPVFQWGERKMWGVSAWIFDLILQRYATLKA